MPGENRGLAGGNQDILEANSSKQISSPKSKLLVEGNKVGPDSNEITVMDQKRRRVEVNQVTNEHLVHAQNANMEVQMENSKESKNELMASTALQSRQAL